MKHTSPVNTGFTHNHRKSLQTKLTCESRFGEAGEEEGYQRLEENESRDCEPSIPIAGTRWNWNWSSSSNNNNVG